MAYLNLKPEITRSGLTLEQILEAGKEDGRITCTLSTLSLKINDKYEFTFSEASALHDIIGTKLSIEELYARTES